MHVPKYFDDHLPIQPSIKSPIIPSAKQTAGTAALPNFMRPTGQPRRVRAFEQ
jgi:hypothetical protein